MARSYESMGMDDLAADTTRVLDMNFPDSTYYHGGPEEDKPWWQLW